MKIFAFRVMLASTVALASGASAVAQSEPPKADAQLVERAKSEGRVVWYTSIPASGSQPVADAFMKQYPEIKVEVQRLAGFGLWQRISAEFQAGKPLADVYSQADYSVRKQAAEQGSIEKYIPPSAHDYPAEFLDKDGYGFSTRVVCIAIGYNTNLVDASKAPKRWTDLLDKQWSDKKIGITDPRSTGTAFAGFWQIRNTAGLGEDYIKKLAAQKPVLYEDSGLQINALVSGEYPIQVLNDYRVWELQTKGAPVKLVYPEDGTPCTNDYTALVAKAPHPNAAKLFMDFYASQKGTDALASKLMTYVVRKDVPVYPTGVGRPELTEIKLLASDPEKQSNEYDSFNKWFTSVVE